MDITLFRFILVFSGTDVVLRNIHGYFPTFGLNELSDYTVDGVSFHTCCLWRAQSTYVI